MSCSPDSGVMSCGHNLFVALFLVFFLKEAEEMAGTLSVSHWCATISDTPQQILLPFKALCHFSSVLIES